MLVDECVYDLIPYLQKRNFRVLTVPAAMQDDKILQDLLSDRIFITKNPRHFVWAAYDYEFGLVGVTDAAMADPNAVANKIAMAHVQHSLKTQIPFILKIGATTTNFRPLTEEVVLQETDQDKRHPDK